MSAPTRIAFTGPFTGTSSDRSAPVVASTAAKFSRGWPFTVSNLPPRYSVDPSDESAIARTSSFVGATVFATTGVNAGMWAPVVHVERGE